MLAGRRNYSSTMELSLMKERAKKYVNSRLVTLNEIRL